MKSLRRVGILTGGGDCPGLNAVIRAVAKRCLYDLKVEVIGFEDGYEGLIQGRYRKLSGPEVSGILTLGGTILGTSNIANPYRYAVKSRGRLEFKDVSRAALGVARKMGISCLVCVGGDGTLSIASKLHDDGLPVVGVPKTIDNDIRGTDLTFGFDTAVSIASEGIDRLHTTAQSHHRIMIVEVMGRRAGWIALHAGVAGGGDIILIPEIPYRLEAIAEKVVERNRHGKRFSIVVVAEGAKAKGGSEVVRDVVKESTDPVRLGGVGFVLADQLQKSTGIEARCVVMGHLQRGGTPTAFDRVLATRLGTAAVDLILKKKFGRVVAVKGEDLTDISLKTVAGKTKTVPPNHPLVASARSVGTSFGD